MSQKAKHYLDQFTPWDPCYVIPFVVDTEGVKDKVHAAAMVERFDQIRIKAAVYVNAVLMDVGHL